MTWTEFCSSRCERSFESWRRSGSKGTPWARASTLRGAHRREVDIR